MIIDNSDNEYFDVIGVIGLPITPVTAERSFIVDFEDVLTFSNGKPLKIPDGGPWWQQEDEWADG